MNVRLPLLALWLAAGTVQAGPNDADLIGLGPEQTLRLNVLAEADPATGPCRVVLGFLDRDGRWVNDGAGREVSRRITLGPGETAYLDIRGGDVRRAGAEDPNVDVLPAVLVEPRDDGANACPGVMARLEMYDRDAEASLAALDAAD